jgi:hypothetical protein
VTAPSVLDVLPELAVRQRLAIRLRPKRLADGEALPRESSKLGGDFLWPADEPWPTCPTHKIPWVGVLQLRADDFPEFRFKSGSDLLQVLWCPQVGHRGHWNPEPVLVWRSAAAVTRPLLDTPRPPLPGPAEEAEEREMGELGNAIGWLRMIERQSARHSLLMAQQGLFTLFSSRWPEWFRAVPLTTLEEIDRARPQAGRAAAELEQHRREPRWAQDTFLPRPCRLRPERRLELPSEFEFTDEQRERVRAAFGGEPDSDVYQAAHDRACATHATKLLGHPAWSQRFEEFHCPRGHLMEHLLTIESCEVGDALTAEENAEYERRIAARSLDADVIVNPSGLTLGDAACEYVFVCRQCPEWPVHSTNQD